MKPLTITSGRRTEFIEITGEVRRIVEREGKKSGMIFLYVPHTTAGLTVNENADPSVKRDITGKMNEIVPADGGYAHSEGNSDAHIKSSLFGNELFFFIEGGQLALGTWQGIYFCEFDGPRKRELYYKIV
jgi:secondary thiamine-phosphate synthase enzyme